jgi:hypothetical protein
MTVDALPDFYIEHLKRLKEAAIQPYFALAQIHNLEIVERIIRRGLYMGPVNGFFSMGGGGSCGANPWGSLQRRLRMARSRPFAVPAPSDGLGSDAPIRTLPSRRGR